jgi:hypothetical protein
LQNFQIIRITNYFPTVNPVQRVHAWWTGAGRAVHRGPTVVWTEGTAARSTELGLRPLGCMEPRRRGRNRERETWGTRLGPHRGSGGAEEAGRRWCRTGRGGNRSAREGWPRRLMPALMALTPFKRGWLDERLRSAIKEGNQGTR